MFTKEYILGLCFIVLVALIWAASSIVAQWVYSSDSFQSPFLMTYVGTSLFALWLPVNASAKWFANKSFMHNLESGNSEFLDNTPYQSVGRESPTGSEAEDETAEEPQEVTIQQSSSSSDGNNNTSMPPLPDNIVVEEVWDDDDHLRVALRIAPVWFIANWSYSASLFYTSITSSTVLASTSALFTFLFAVLCKDESFSIIKLAGVLFGVSGGIVTALHDASSSSSSSSGNNSTLTSDPDDTQQQDISDPLALLGDFLGVLSAVGYGAYAVQTRVYCPKDESLYSMQILLGYIGLLNMTLLSPIAIYVLLSSSHVEWFVMGCVIFKGLFDNFLSDYLWLRAVLLTNATVATVGLGLTIPLAFASDLIMGKSGILSVGSIVGALAVLVGFVLVNVGTEEERVRAEEEGVDHENYVEASFEEEASQVELRDGPERRTLD